jgi:ubiquinol-cytochrome c reductase cytochrome c subunit
MTAAMAVLSALALAAGLLGQASGQQTRGGAGLDQPTGANAGSVSAGRDLFRQGCSDCHGMDGSGVAGVAPDLHGVGEQAADFYLRTGRMPLDDPEDEPVRSDSPYSKEQIADLVAYVGSLGGPPIPQVDAGQGQVSHGFDLFRDHCAGCHQIVAQGGIVTRGVVPDLQQATPTDVAEAVRIGPYVMPKFSHLSPREIDDLAAYVTYTRDPQDRGGWGIGHIGPIPEGMIAWLLAGAALLLAIRLIGERTTE